MNVVSRWHPDLKPLGRSSIEPMSVRPDRMAFQLPRTEDPVLALFRVFRFEVKESGRLKPDDQQVARIIAEGNAPIRARLKDRFEGTVGRPDQPDVDSLFRTDEEPSAIPAESTIPAVRVRLFGTF